MPKGGRMGLLARDRIVFTNPRQAPLSPVHIVSQEAKSEGVDPPNGL